MVQTLQAKNVSLKEVRTLFSLEYASQDAFFQAWKADFPSLTQTEQNQIARVQKNYQNLFEQGLSEESVKMVVLSPLLDLAGFYQAPFNLRTEESIELISEDDGTVVKGKIDVLFAADKFWILAIETKSTQYDVLIGLPQALTYMMSAPNSDRPVYGLLANGREFVFIKLVQAEKPVYARSPALSVEEHDELGDVLQALKRVRDDVLA